MDSTTTKHTKQKQGPGHRPSLKARWFSDAIMHCLDCWTFPVFLWRSAWFLMKSNKTNPRISEIWFSGFVLFQRKLDAGLVLGTHAWNFWEPKLQKTSFLWMPVNGLILGSNFRTILTSKWTIKPPQKVQIDIRGHLKPWWLKGSIFNQFGWSMFYRFWDRFWDGC